MFCVIAIFYVAIASLLRKPVTVQKCTLSIAEIDLDEVYQPYVIVRGLPPFVCGQTDHLKQHFETLSSTQIQSIDVQGTEACIRFVNPSGRYSIHFFKNSLTYTLQKLHFC